MTQVGDIAVFIDPVTHHFTRDELFNPANPHNVDNAHAPYFHLRETFESKGIEVHTADFLMEGKKAAKTNVYFSFGILDNYEKLAQRNDVILSGYFTLDAPIVLPSTFRALRKISRYFKRVFSYTTSDAVERFGCKGLRFHKFHIPYCYDRVFDELWKKKDRKFLTLLNYNRLSRMKWQELYTERLKAVEYFSRFGEIDLYGLGWDRPPYRVGETRIPVTLTLIHRYLRQHLPFIRMHPYQDAVRRAYRGVA